MSSIKVPITKTDKEGFQVIIDLNLYSEKAITATIYKYTDKFFVYQNTIIVFTTNYSSIFYKQ